MHAVLIASANHLEAISSGAFLSEQEFYYLLEESGRRAVDLCSLAIAERQVNGESADYNSLICAAECLKEICVQSDNYKWQLAMSSAGTHARNLHLLYQQYERE